ncbi:hypothetical protein BC939DRAFT_153301 [Gamsiella multidivaricata]|uniref:uncharacterized protein n=1 Tax=Gamsiella multidivaricata TaxID=101098 RepID=UPI002220CA2B|nr:uncharacterized protein BC939DRAFT_153301 [Gamsiella multidivaricata]KAI7824096.1 hypothetical protein BC939DRAFT_153301 [Gamsiella multidivaricata]
MGLCPSFPSRLSVPWALLIMPSHHFWRGGRDLASYLYSDFRHGIQPDSNVARANPVSAAYGGKYDCMAVTSVDDTLCIRWPTKKHATKNQPSNMVNIHLSKVHSSKDGCQSDRFAQEYHCQVAIQELYDRKGRGSSCLQRLLQGSPPMPPMSTCSSGDGC